MVVPEKVLAGVLPGWSWMLDSLSKPPGGKCIMMGRSLLEKGRGKVSVEMFNPLDEGVVWKNIHAALVHPLEVNESFVNRNHQKEPLPEALRKLCKETQYDVTKEEKRQLSGLLRSTPLHSNWMVNHLEELIS